MLTKRPWLVLSSIAMAFGGFFVDRAFADYETAEYTVIKTDGPIEIREYPDLQTASTTTNLNAAGRDGSFMRLFGYISGANEGKQKIAMTTPVFMQGRYEDVADSGAGQMSFVIPKKVAAEGVPSPTGEEVSLQTRKGGKFAVIRFSGRMRQKLVEQQESKLRQWIQSNGLEAEDVVETAGYDAPFTPPLMRRNEVLIRLK